MEVQSIDGNVQRIFSTGVPTSKGVYRFGANVSGAAIPAAIFYNHFGHVIREIGARMEDFSLEFMNLAERSFED